VLPSRVPPIRSRRLGSIAAPSLALIATAVAITGWTRAPHVLQRRSPSVAIRDVRPLQTDDAKLRNLITHTFAVSVSVAGWRLLPYKPGAGSADNRSGAGHWRLYLDGYSLGDTYGDEQVAYTPYLTPGAHWIAAELSNADGTSLRTPVWSEPVLLHVPRAPIPQVQGTRASERLTSGKERP
jgi:hypothetical protein